MNQGVLPLLTDSYTYGKQHTNEQRSIAYLLCKEEGALV